MKKYTEIGQRLKELRGNLSQKEFARKLGISFAAYQNYEYGKRVPPGSVLARIAQGCHVTTDYILTGDVASLYRLLREKTKEHAALEKDLKHLDKRMLQKLSSMGSALRAADELLRLAEFATQYGLNLSPLIEKYFSEKFSIENILLNVKKEKAIEVDLMKDIVERVEKIFENKKLHLRPKDKATLIILLYDYLKNSTEKKISNERILKEYKNLKSSAAKINDCNNSD